MRYEIETWTIKKLIKLYQTERLRLDPPYQRNPIWSKNAQRLLIDTIKKGQPIPNFFVRRLEGDSFEMVDGQQRSRTIVGYDKGKFSDHDKISFDKISLGNKYIAKQRSQFLQYLLVVVVISDLREDESIELFYALVNSTGLRLNRPELKKAQYYNTNFLELMTDCAESDQFLSLRLFTPSHINRMEHIDFVSELLAILKFGLSDKKEKVDALFETDISKSEVEEITFRFHKVLSHFCRFNSIVPLYKTRYRQKNDFYSLFAFISQHSELGVETLNYHYQILLKLGPHIRPSQEECPPLMEYAYHCVTQSNSKNARERRLEILESILLNPVKEPNNIQQEIEAFFKASDSLLVKKSKYWTFNLSALLDSV